MTQPSKEKHVSFLLSVALAGWLVPGAGYLLLKETKRATIIFVSVTLTFFIGLYIGSVGVIDPVGALPWFIAQMMNSPAVAILGQITKGGAYLVRGRPSEIAQIYTSIAGLLNLLCIVNAVYLAHLRYTQTTGDQNRDR